jgi:hypothetical protein
MDFRVGVEEGNCVGHKLDLILRARTWQLSQEGVILLIVCSPDFFRVFRVFRGQCFLFLDYFEKHTRFIDQTESPPPSLAT